MKKFRLGKLFSTVCALLSFVLVFSIAACGGGDGGSGGGESNGLTLNAYTLSIDKNGNSPLLVTSPVTEDVIWTSSDESKVTVTGSGAGKRMGTVSAVEIGTAVITAKSGENFATCTVNVLEAETITVTKDGSAVSSDVTISGKDATVQLSATSSRGHDIAWESSKPLIASVSENGLVTALASSGTVVIKATCAQHSNVSKSVTVVIGSGQDAAYNLEKGDENGQFGNYNSNDNPGVWVYWNQFNNVANATYDSGVVSLQTTGVEEGAWWYNVQLFYTATAADKDTAGNALKGGTHYKLTFDINTTMGGDITVNKYVLHLNEGANHCTVYYDQTATAFAMQLGVEGVGCNLTNANITLSNLVWEVSAKENLVAPSFSITDNVITINDGNPAGSVGSYTLNLYNDSGVSVGGVMVTNGTKIDTSKIKPNGTYTGKLVANAANAHYVTAPEATSQNASVVVNNEHVTYDMDSSGEAGALKETGVWTYWTENWVSFKGTVTDDVANITFSNNSGNWYDTQLFYKIPGKNAGATYKVTLHINNVPKAGRITVNDVVKNLTAGDNAIELNITETSGATVKLVFGVVNESNKQDIQAATNLEVYLETN